MPYHMQLVPLHFGMGKTTIMKLLARRKLPVPDFIDILLVEQEVVGDDRTALESVIAADVELQNLRKKKMELEAAMEKIAAAEEKGGVEGSKEREEALVGLVAPFTTLLSCVKTRFNR